MATMTDDLDFPSEDVDVDLSTCPYYRGEGQCMFGCYSEPSCFTDRPRDGWPSERTT